MAKPKNESTDSPNSKSRLTKKPLTTTEAFEAALKGSPLRRAKYILRLYVTGSSTRSLKAVYNLKKLCDEHLHNDYELEVIDIYKNPDAAREAQIVAIPTLIKKLPEPLRRFVGDLSNTHKILVGLDLYKGQEQKGRPGSA